MYPDDVRRQLAGRPGHLRVGGSYTRACTIAPVRPLQLDRARHRQVPGVGPVVHFPAQDRHLGGDRVHGDDRQRLTRPARHPDDHHAVRAEPGRELPERDVQIGQLGCLGVEDAQAHAAAAVQHREPAIAEHRERPRPQLPQRAGELLLGREQRLRRLAGQPDLVDVPPPGPVGGHVQAGVVAPHRGQHGLPQPALDQPALAGDAVLDGRDPQLGTVPRHVRVIPADPGQPAAVRRRGGEGEEVRSGGQLPDRLRLLGRRAVQRHGDDRAGHLAAGVPFLDAPHFAAVGGEHEVSKTQPGRLQPGPADRGRIGRQRARRGRLLGLRRLHAGQVEPLVRVVREDNRITARRPAAGRAGARKRAGPAGRTIRRIHAPGSARSTAQAAGRAARRPRRDARR